MNYLHAWRLWEVRSPPHFSGVEIRQCHYLPFNCGYLYHRNDVRNYRKLVMATNESQINQIYGSEDAQGILQLAIARRQDEGELSRVQLFEIAAELGISEQDILAAEQQWLATRGEFQEKLVFNTYRRRKLQKNVTKYGIINTFLVLFNLAAAHELSWSLFILLTWGLGLSLNAWNVYQTEGEDYEQAFQRWRLKKQVGQSIGTATNKFMKWLQS
ncbi:MULTISPECIES: 2TM domain-containing protein [unclassified Microcoleus]|uniref:2TM domain-containing protein n=1 Tax=unclassified Microcoleus TaxID=2642155 RepID=UPI002FD64FD4